MPKRKSVLLILLLGLCTFALYKYLTTQTIPFTPKPLRPLSTTILMPLDNRPPCLSFVQELGGLAQTKVISPPRSWLGNYYETGEKVALYNWLTTFAPAGSSLIISSDALIHGGLVGSRLPVGNKNDETYFLNYIRKLRKNNPSSDISIFTVIPRLLISDQLIPEAWWQWHLMRWSALQDIQDNFDDPVTFAELQKFNKEIPEEIIKKYTEIYRHNDNFNHRLLAVAKEEELPLLVIGQDDGQPFGLPNRNRHRLLYTLQHEHMSNDYFATRGADELGAVILAARFNKQHNYRPQIYVEYSSPKVKDLFMPFMSCSVGEAVSEKIALLGGQTTPSVEGADFILFVHCGTDKPLISPKEAAKRLQKLSETAVPLALIDLSQNFSAAETLVPLLLSNNFPLSRLTAFAGWNTASNSIGTALAQASIFTLQKKIQPPGDYPDLYAANLRFTVSRLLDDWAYQKVLHGEISSLITLRALDAYNLNASDQQKAEKLIYNLLRPYAKELLANLRQEPFYTNDAGSYYLNDFTYSLNLPWQRTFEIEINLLPSYSFKTKNT